MRQTIRTAQITLLALILAWGGLDSICALAAGRQGEAQTPQQAPRVASTVPQAQAAPAGSATLAGTINFSGKAPEQKKIKMGADPICLGQHTQAVMTEEVVTQGGKLQYVFVYVKEGISGDYPAPEESVVLDQSGCVYQPHVLGLQVGQKLEIRNSDSTLHNINCKPKENRRFNLAQPVKGMKTFKTFTKQEVGIPFRCNVHPWMVAYAGVVNHPFFGVSDENGNFKLSGLPAGTYTVEAWHEKLGSQTQTVTVAEGESQTLEFTFQAS